MTMRKSLGIMVAASVIAGGVAASGAPAATRAMAVPKKGWRAVATQTDRERLRTWHDAWTEALARARIGNAAKIDADAELFDPDRALGGAVPPPGRYRCRVFKLGAKGTAMADFTTYSDGACDIAALAGASSFVKVAGAQRPSGIIFHDNDTRAMFLGSMMLADETRPMVHGRDAGRDMTGYVERIGDKRWRLVLPYPRFESILDVIELVPAP